MFFIHYSSKCRPKFPWSTRRALRHLRTHRALAHLLTWRALEGHSRTSALKALKVLEQLEQLGTRGTLSSRLIISFLLPYPTNQQQDLNRKKSLKDNYLVKLSTQQSLSSAIQRNQCKFTLTCNYISSSYIQFS